MEQSYTDRVKSNKKQQSKISWKRAEARKMADAIHSFLADQGIDLPGSKLEYDNQRNIIFAGEHRQYERLDKKGKHVGNHIIYCVDTSAADYFGQLINLYYKIIGCNKGIYAMFSNLGVTVPMLMMCWYTKHRLDPVWLMRKSQLIRRLYLQYFDVAMVEDLEGRQVKLVDYLQPYHLTLTVPHKDGLFEGERFYAQKLNYYFLQLRRSPHWKEAVHGGEYGIEVKPSHTGNGLHIHIHSLLFLKKTENEEYFTRWVKNRWKKLTGATELHFEKLYTWQTEWSEGCVEVPVTETINGRKMQKVAVTIDENGEPEAYGVYRYKKHILPGTDVKEYMKGVLECIKYHFKTDAIADEKGFYDVPLMADILNNSRGLRFYSKFGAFYKEPLLNFDVLKTPADMKDEVEMIDAEAEAFNPEADINGKAATAINNLVNPFTNELATEEQYTLAVAVPEHLRYSGKKAIKPYELLNYDDAHFTPIEDKNASLGDVVKLMVENKLHSVLGQRPRPRKNTRHAGYYEHDWYMGEAPVSFDFDTVTIKL